MEIGLCALAVHLWAIVLGARAPIQTAKNSAYADRGMTKIITGDLGHDAHGSSRAQRYKDFLFNRWHANHSAIYRLHWEVKIRGGSSL